MGDGSKRYEGEDRERRRDDRSDRDRDGERHRRRDRTDESHRSRRRDGEHRDGDRRRSRRDHEDGDGADSARKRRDRGGSNPGDLQERHNAGDDDIDNDDQPGPAPPPRTHPRLEELGVSPLTEEDYFLKAAEFKVWLSESRGKYLDETSSKEARRYFAKFVDRWNTGKLSDDFYLGKVRSAAAPSSSQTRHKWGFASKASYTQAEQDALASVRDTVDTMTNAETRGAAEAREAERRASKGRRMRDADSDEATRTATGANSGAADSGWGSKRSSTVGACSGSVDRPSSDRGTLQDSAKRRRLDEDARELAEELAPRATGREALIQKKREKNAANRDFANRKEDDGLELDDATLMGGDDPHAPLVGPRSERGVSRREQARQERRAERQAEMQERVSALKTKEQETMAMFKQVSATLQGPKMGGYVGKGLAGVLRRSGNTFLALGCEKGKRKS
ncbi:hypothetical protein ACQY0O_001329 [Thecaphora frezii]